MITLNQIEQEVTNQNLKQVQIITIAMNLGVALFAAVCAFLYSNASNIETSDNDFINYLLIGLFIVSITAYSLSLFIPRNLLRSNISQEKQGLIGSINTYQIVKLALLEGPALFGLVILIISITGGQIYSDDYVLIGLLPLLIMLVVSILTFPTVFKIKTLLKSILEEIQFN